MTEKTYRLRAPTGTDEANHGETRYPVRDGFVDVPAEAVEPLTRVGGFVLLGETPAPAPLIAPPSAEFVEAVDSALATIAPGADIAYPSAELVAEVVEALQEIAAKEPTPHAAPTIPRLVIPT